MCVCLGFVLILLLKAGDSVPTMPQILTGFNFLHSDSPFHPQL